MQDLCLRTEKIMTDKNTFYNMLKSNAESQPDAVAVVYDTMKVTYAKLFDDVIFVRRWRWILRR